MELLLLLGGNIGDPRAMLGLAEALIDERVGHIRARSRDHWTEPWGFNDARLFLNRALLVDTEHAPEAALTHCSRIEDELGRERTSGGYAARTIDIDLLLWQDRTIDLPDLRIPHPRMHQRAFALAPAADIAPHWPHPTLNRTVLMLLNDVLHNP